MKQIDSNVNKLFDQMNINDDQGQTGQTGQTMTRKKVQKVSKVQTNSTNQEVCLLSDITANEKQLNQLRDLIELPLKRSPNGRQINGKLPKVGLLFGPSGTGKTATIKALCNELKQKMFCVYINCATIMGKTFAVSEQNLRDIFDNAIKMSPSSVFLDNFEIICSKSKGTDQEKRLICVLADILDELTTVPNIVVVMITNRPELIDSNLRRSRRIDKEIEFSVPLPSERYLILNKLLNKQNSNVSEEVLRSLADSAHSMTGADLDLVYGFALQSALKDNRHIISEEDLTLGLKSVRPSAMREISLEVPKVFWKDIGGMHQIRERLTQCIVWPLTRSEAFKRLGIEAPKGVLMYGPPGCCKTMIGKALATECGLNFMSIKGPELFNKWVGESERAVREVFRKARAAAPSILFFDEIDGLTAKRDNSHNEVGNRVLTQMLTEIDGIEKLDQVVIIAATNRPDLIDMALLRPGRLDSILYVPLPDFKTRSEIFAIKISKMRVSFELSDEVLERLSELTEGYSGAEIVAVCHEAGLLALKENIDCESIEFQHFEASLHLVEPKTTQKSIEFYEKYKNEFNKNY